MCRLPDHTTLRLRSLARWWLGGLIVLLGLARLSAQTVPSGGQALVTGDLAIDGINISVPRGTEVHAAENGTVTYAGNEVQGYGNLVLIRHPEGWITAYAHNDNLMVKAGDTVRRGQVIAKAGNTGSVSQPQLHFEIRQGATPVDPMQHLER